MIRRKGRLPPYVQGFEDRHGAPRHYFRRHGRRTPLPGKPWSPGFMTAHAVALAASEVAPTDRTTADRPNTSAAPAPRKKLAKGAKKSGTISALIAEYRASNNFTSLAPSTAVTYGRLLDKLDTGLGHLAVASLDTPMLEKAIEIRAAQGGPEAGNNLRRILRAVMKFAVKRRYRTDDPMLTVDKIKRPKGAKKGFRTWTEADIAKFMLKFPLGTRQYLALALLLCGGQRRGDTSKLGPSNILGPYDPKDFHGREIVLTQKKTGKDLTLPIHPMLCEALALADVPADAPGFLLSSRGTPYTPESFTGTFTEWAGKAGIEGQASPHGLRKAAARRLAEAGCSVKLIASITGHVTLKEIENYTKDADQRSSAKLALQLLLGQQPQ
jgi:integrase